MSMPPYQYDSRPPLEYAGRAESYGRPGVLTAVGVISIVVGSLSVLGSIGTVASGIMYMVMSNIQFPQPVMVQPATTMPAGGASPSNVVVGPGGTVQRAPPPVVLPAFRFQVPRSVSLLTIAEGGLSLCVAVLLIVAGALMLRDNPVSWRLHWIWVSVKIPLIFVAAGATYLTYTSMMNAMTPAMGPNNPQGMGGMVGLFEAFFGGIISLIYPVALMIVLSVRTSKAWLGVLRGGQS
jgi:hypothetical protein